jgi:two-component system NarL family sensor kinase
MLSDGANGSGPPSPTRVKSLARQARERDWSSQVAQARAALRQVTGQLRSVREEERERIAVELHESTSRYLVAIALGVARLRRTVGASVRANDILDDMSSCVGEAAQEIRAFSYLMKPIGLKRDGLGASVAAFVKGFGWRTGLNTRCNVEGFLDPVSVHVGHAAFRVLQEALGNVFRHAQAKSVEVELVKGGGVLTLRIADDGRGIDGSLLNTGGAHRLGVGVAGMRARVQQLGGTLEITSSDAGTVVLARIPLRQRRSLQPAADGRMQAGARSASATLAWIPKRPPGVERDPPIVG